MEQDLNLLGAKCLLDHHIVLLHLSDGGAPDETGQIRQKAHDQGNVGQEEMPQQVPQRIIAHRVHTHNGEDLHAEAEDINQKHGKPEGRRGNSDGAETIDHLIRPAVLVASCHQSQHNGQHVSGHIGGQNQYRRVGDPDHQVILDAGMGQQGISEIPVQNIVQPPEILDVYRVIEPVGFSAHLDLRSAHIRGGDRIHRIVGSHIDQCETDHRN